MVFTLTRTSTQHNTIKSKSAGRREKMYKNILSISAYFNSNNNHNIITARFVIYVGWKRRVKPRENKSTHICRENGHQIVSCERNIHDTTMTSTNNEMNMLQMECVRIQLVFGCVSYIFNCHLNLFESTSTRLLELIR